MSGNVFLDGVNFMGYNALSQADIEGQLAINPLTSPSEGRGILDNRGLQAAKVGGGVSIGNGISSIGDNFFYNINIFRKRCRDNNVLGRIGSRDISNASFSLGKL